MDCSAKKQVLFKENGEKNTGFGQKSYQEYFSPN